MSSENIVNSNRPGVMKLLVNSMIPVYIHRKISPVIIRYTISIPVRIQSPERIVIIK